MDYRKRPGAGVICYFDNRDNKIPNMQQDVLFLILEDNHGKYDLPKGCLDNDEKNIECAIRETEEEINLQISDFERFLIDDERSAHKCGNNLTLFLAEIKKEAILGKKPKININPVSLIKEHKNFYFLTKEEANNNLHIFLNKSLDWAYNIILYSNL